MRTATDHWRTLDSSLKRHRLGRTGVHIIRRPIRRPPDPASTFPETPREPRPVEGRCIRLHNGSFTSARLHPSASTLCSHPLWHHLELYGAVSDSLQASITAPFEIDLKVILVDVEVNNEVAVCRQNHAERLRKSGHPAGWIFRIGMATDVALAKGSFWHVDLRVRGG